VLGRIRKTLTRIRRAPLGGAPHPEFGEWVRLWSARPYLIYADVTPDRVEVLRILHHARDRNTIMGAWTDDE